MLRKNKKIVSICTMAALLITSSLIPIAVKADAASTESSRIWGQDRYETAAKVSEKGWTSSDYVVIASGEGYADALCAAPLAKANNAPILLTENDKLNDKTLDELKRLNVKHVYIIGGEGSISKKVEDTIKSQVTSDIQRLWGKDRYETSAKVAEKLGIPSKVVLASGDGYADALSAAPVAAIEGMPILLTESKSLSKPTADYIKSNPGITRTYVIGGYASVSDAAMASVPNPQRFGGADRFETNSAVINAFSADFDFKNAYVVLGDGPNGNEFADALTGAVLAAKNKNPLIITSNVLSESTKALIKAKLTAGSTLSILGGTANISSGLVGEMGDLITTTPSNQSSGGSGGSSGSGTTYEDLTSLVSNTYGSKIQSYLTAHPILDKYLDVTTGNVIQIKLTNCKWNTVSEMFQIAKTEASTDQSKFGSRIDILQSLLDMPYMTKTSVGGNTVKGYLESIYPSYFDTTGNLRKTEIATRLGSNELNYNSFITNLKNKMKSNPTIGFKLSDSYNLTIDKIVKDGSTIYDKTWTGAQNAAFLNTDNISDLTGNYTIYSGKYIIRIQITK